MRTKPTVKLMRWTASGNSSWGRYASVLVTSGMLMLMIMWTDKWILSNRRWCRGTFDMIRRRCTSFRVIWLITTWAGVCWCGTWPSVYVHDKRSIWARSNVLFRTWIPRKISVNLRYNIISYLSFLHTVEYWTICSSLNLKVLNWNIFCWNLQ